MMEQPEVVTASEVKMLLSLLQSKFARSQVDYYMIANFHQWRIRIEEERPVCYNQSKNTLLSLLPEIVHLVLISRTCALCGSVLWTVTVCERNLECSHSQLFKYQGLVSGPERLILMQQDTL